MEIRVKRNSVYKELVVVDDDVQIDTGLLDEHQCISLYLNVIDALSALLPSRLNEYDSELDALINKHF